MPFLPMPKCGSRSCREVRLGEASSRRGSQCSHLLERRFWPAKSGFALKWSVIDKTQPQLLLVSVKSCEAVLQTCLCAALTRVWVPLTSSGNPERTLSQLVKH
jgi:hypothetical protein